MLQWHRMQISFSSVVRFIALAVCSNFVVAGEMPKVPGLDADWTNMRPIVPRGYVCVRAKGPITIDGKADEPSWADAPWTEDFMDIEGAKRPAPRFRTHAKMLWDDQYLYIHAELDEPHVWGTITKKNEVIFADNDFEIFIDPNSDNHNYYEFEMNALNTIWELTLIKPYRDGGPVKDKTNIPGLKTAVHINGTINDPTNTDKSWSVEIAIPWKGLEQYAGSRSCPPKDADQWRIDFSRVEWIVDIIDGKYRKVPKEMRAEDNWVWSPQGVVDMHRPERWGYVQFSSKAPGEAKFKPDETLAARDRLMEVYHRQREFMKRYDRYASSPQELGITKQGADETPIGMVLVGNGYTATMRMVLPDGTVKTLNVRDDSKLWEE